MLLPEYPSASSASSNEFLMLPIQGLQPVRSNERQSLEKEQEPHVKIVLCPSVTQRKYAVWHILTDPTNRSSLDLLEIYQTEDPRIISLSHKLIPVNIPLQSQNMGCISSGDVYRALYSALQNYISREYLLTLSEDERNRIDHAYRARCLELPEAVQEDRTYPRLQDNRFATW